ncbi:MAG: sulfotransferase [Pseudomonadota bacterium]
MTGPTFICPGAQKAGTTWLHKTLQEHPDFWMPPQKEVDYLAEFPKSREKYGVRLAAVEERWANRPKNQWRVDWWRLFTSEWNLDKYGELFAPAGAKLSGDVSPNYSMMSAQEVMRAASVAPEAKIVILLRDPVARAWSHARHVVFRGPKADLPEDERQAATEQFAMSKRCLGNGDYVSIINAWRSAFGSEKVFVGFYDDLATQPQLLLSQILAFLGANAPPTREDDEIGAVVNQGTSMSCSEETLTALKAHYAPMVEQLRTMLPEQGSPDWLKA